MFFSFYFAKKKSFILSTGSTLLPDFFLDVGPDDPKLRDTKDGSSAQGSGTDKVPEAFTALKTLLSEQLVNEVKASYQFNLSGQ